MQVNSIQVESLLPSHDADTDPIQPDALSQKQGMGAPARQLSLRYAVGRPLRAFLVTDSIALIAGGFCAWALAFLINAVFFNRYDLGHISNEGLIQVSQSILVGACVILWFAHSSHYRVRMPFWTKTKKIIEAVGLAMLIDMFLRCLVKEDFSRLWLVMGWVMAGANMVLFRVLWRRHMQARGLWNVKTILIGGGATARDAIVAFASEPQFGFDIVAQIGDFPLAFRQSGSSWTRLCARHDAHYIIVAMDGDELAAMEAAFARLMREDVPFSVSPPLHSMPVFGMTHHYFFNHDVMLLTHNHGLHRRLPRLIKRGFDIAVASCALVILSPLLLAVAFLIRMDGGPALFGHKRLGFQGGNFRCLKFRSMVVRGNEVLKRHFAENPAALTEWQHSHKLRDDPRITPIGKFLRKTSMDELPQLLNVLKGEMSIVGPRPIIMAETGKYDEDISHYYRVRPGITGAWQVSGRNDVSYAERVQMDSWYVRNWALWHDIMIICKTFPAVFKRGGAY